MKKNFLIVSISVILAILVSILGYQRFKKEPLVSVVMLTYKRADILPQAIESILTQTFKDYEFIILNDGSPDNTDDVVKKYTDSRIRYYKNPKNMGIAYSRNRVTSLARGKYIAIMDDDDISLPNRLKKQVEFLEKNPDVVVVSGQIKDSIWPPVPQDSDLLASQLIQTNNIGNANTMFRRDFVLNHKITYPNLDYGEDWYFWLEILFAGGKFAAIPDEVIYRQDFTLKHYQANPQHTYEVVNNYVGSFFSPHNPQAFYEANACEKVKMIAQTPTKILSPTYTHQLIKLNCD